MDEDIKFVFWLYIAGAVVFWIAGVNLGYYTIGFVAVGFILFLSLMYYEGVTDAKRKEELEIRKIKLARMSEEERKAYLAQERADKRLEQKEAELRYREHQLEEREQKLKRHVDALKAAQRTQQPDKVPFAVKATTAAVVGHKVGKTIAKW